MKIKVTLSMFYENTKTNEPDVYCEYDTDAFKKQLVAEYKKIHSVGVVDNTTREVERSFERTVLALRDIARRHNV